MKTATGVLTLVAGVASVVLTGIAFWLSYEHLHDVAGEYGLGASPERAWAWPATVDLFILVGEVLMLRASLRGRGIDWWAVALAGSGSLGSIALNVAGVGDGAEPMEYVVAAVPPVAALLAFGALMRQLHGLLAAHGHASGVAEMPAKSPTLSSREASPASVSVAALGAGSGGPKLASSEPVVSLRKERPAAPAKPGSGTSGTATARSARKQTARSRGSSKPSGKAPRRSMSEWVELTEPVFHDEFQKLRRQPTASEFAEAIKEAGHGRPSDSTAKNIRTEILDRTDVPALD
ncbi:DUF2637 domain-containing protein [Streptomyces reniochalinae]|uniref:DUF2637 domain-containing protein n=1 Tax=Streptomyces reniochalinae TaxID=2250578 RepID=A0A367EUI4_9ACTN|nr:DUF2637 domain-containing protein [Streptomyces reniochalinae]RCG21768.1 DUF2637 domain-containing protein [Streptomyces reniochalinae]